MPEDARSWAAFLLVSMVSWWPSLGERVIPGWGERVIPKCRACRAPGCGSRRRSTGRSCHACRARACHGPPSRCKGPQRRQPLADGGPAKVVRLPFRRFPQGSAQGQESSRSLTALEVRRSRGRGDVQHRERVVGARQSASCSERQSVSCLLLPSYPDLPTARAARPRLTSVGELGVSSCCSVRVFSAASLG